ncbi:uncharacterized protein M421DRAFT_95029 [Didymella exigua CBS 183.55]|uniref:DUF2034 domain-containing protein n=1 Tax=Didymella exigua CBS 183.55 TaxID=1150837 RepID=A0A6A5RB49_9PLEO|nr:uncharacterized protein M421DRAFT_95029 [Didymella exigua CBS 183.55]KAF1924872.1 hypothetical protein M421DRAFT_95029 [Didymella exigua CBS 183.55]
MRPILRVAWLRHAALLPWHPRTPPQSLVPRRIATTSAQNAAPVDLPRLIVRNGHKGHNSLPTFLEYVNRTNLAPLSSVYIGTHYEYTTALAFMRLGFSLLRVGSKNDAGIDLIGHWVLAPLSEPLPVIIQCKARKCSLSPSHIRELEGSFRGTPPNWKGKPVLGLLVTTLKATKGTLDAMARSPWPMGFVMMSKHGLIQQFVWNKAASDRGLEGVGVSMRHTPRALLAESEMLEAEEEPPQRKKLASKFANTGTQKDIQLTWMGSPIFSERDHLDQDTLDMIRMIELGEDRSMRPTAPLAHPRRGRGRPKKEEDATKTSTPARKGRKPTLHLAPSPRGGQIAVPRGPPKPRCGRPPGSKNKPKVEKDAG